MAHVLTLFPRPPQAGAHLVQDSHLFRIANDAKKHINSSNHDNGNNSNEFAELVCCQGLGFRVCRACRVSLRVAPSPPEMHYCRPNCQKNLHAWKFASLRLNISELLPNASCPSDHFNLNKTRQHASVATPGSGVGGGL